MPIDLTQFDDAFGSAEAPEANAFDVIPNGKYPVHVEKVEITETKTGKNKGQPRLSWQLVIDGGDHDGRYVFHSNRIVKDDSKVLGWLKADLKIAGVTLNKLSELPGHLSELLDKRLMVKVVNTTKDGQDFQNVYIQSRIKEGDSDTTNPDIPF